MKKNYVLDTNVLLHDPESIHKFEDNTVNIPMSVIEEIDHFKKNADSNGRNARQISRLLDSFRLSGDLRKGVPMGNGGMLRVAFGMDYGAKLPPELNTNKADNIILGVCLALREAEPDIPVVFVTKDTNLRIKGSVFGIKSEDYEGGKVSVDELYGGVAKALASREQIDELFKNGSVTLSLEEPLLINQYVSVVNHSDPKHSGLGRHVGGGTIVALRLPKDIWGIHPKNREQRFALDALLDPEISLVTLIGRAGTGKTLLAIAAGLQKTVEESLYKRLLVSRPIIPMGRDIGFLPGDVQEKLRPWMQPIFDNIEFLFGGVEGRDGTKTRGYEELISLDKLSLEPLTYIRGRSIPYQYMIVDEAQNLTPHECKTIITRVGEGTKIVLTGDPYQIDNPYVDAMSNGLSYCLEKFKDRPIAAHVTLTKGERSSLAELAAEIL